MEVFNSGGSKVVAWTERQIDRDSTDVITYLHTRMLITEIIGWVKESG